MINQIFGGFYIDENHKYENKYIFSSLTNLDPKTRPSAEEVLSILDNFEKNTDEARYEESIADVVNPEELFVRFLQNLMHKHGDIPV